MQGLGRGKAGKIKKKKAKQGYGIQALANLRKVLNPNQLLVPKAVFERVLRFDFFFLLFLPFSIFSLVPLISLASPFQIKDISFIQGSYRSCCQKGKVEQKAEVEKLPVRSCRCSFPPDRPRQNLDFLSNKNVRKTRQLYVVYQKFVKMYNSFQITSLWIVCKVFRLSGQSLDCQDSF